MSRKTREDPEVFTWLMRARIAVRQEPRPPRRPGGLGRAVTLSLLVLLAALAVTLIVAGPGTVHLDH
jgi:hypothetical protein